MRGQARQTNDCRLLDREAQTRSWAAPLPDFSRDVRAPLMRAEWETRDTINNRAFADMMASGPKAVTSAGIALHPSHGANTMNPTPARKDERTYLSGQLYPDAGRPGVRPERPPHSLFQNAWLDGFDVESRDTARELRAGVREDRRWEGQDMSNRLMGRTFEHQWAAPGFGMRVAQQIDAAVSLRPVADDYQRSWRSN
jgi:hypothetical protein